MPLQAFCFPYPETRFFRAGSFIYKFKIRGGSSYSGKVAVGGNHFNREMEEIIRAVLSNLDSLQPFHTPHFIVFPYKKQWEGVSKVMCKLGDKALRAYPFIVILYLEANMQNGRRAEERLSPVSCSVNHKEEEVAQKCSSVPEPPSKRWKRDSPLEDAILKDFTNDLEAESKISMVGRLRVDCLHPRGEAKEDPGHVSKTGTGSCDQSGQESAASTAEVHPGTNLDMGQDGGVEGGRPGTPERPGALARLASHIFPFSLFFRDT